MGRGWARRLVSIRIAPDTAKLSPGQSTKFTVAGVFSDGRTKAITLSWKATGGTVDSTGGYTAGTTPGTYQVVGNEPVTGLADTAVVVDQPAPVGSPPPVDTPPPDQPPADQPPATAATVSLSPASSSILAGNTVQLTATAKDSTDATMSGLTFVWTSSNTAVATVSSAGVVKGIKAGSVTVTATVDGASGNAAVAVTAPVPPPAPSVATVSLSPSSTSILAGNTVQLTATAKDSSGATMSGLTFAWSSSNTAVATVSTAGLVKGLKAGSVTIAAGVQGVSGSAAVAVTAPVLPPPPPPPPSDDCSTSGSRRVVSVSTASELSTAVANAQPGDLIELAAGTYNGRWSITHSGTAAAPISLCGPRTAVLNGGSLSSGNVIFLDGANYWVLRGFTLTGALGGVAGNNANYNQILSLDIRNVGQAGVHLRVFSTHNLIRDNLIHNTGKYIAQYGEGVYIGTAETQWCTKTGCQPDRSDQNQVIGNTISATTADGIQMMAGTTGGLIRKNAIDGGGMVAIAAAPPHWVLAMGNDILVDSNTAVNALTHGMKVRRSSTASAWGHNDVFVANRMDVGSSGYGIFLETGPADGMVVQCSNVATNAGSGLSNVGCTQ